MIKSIQRRDQLIGDLPRGITHAGFMRICRETRVVAAATVALVAYLLAGCSSQGTGPSPTGDPAASSTSPTPSDSTPSASAPSTPTPVPSTPTLGPLTRAGYGANTPNGPTQARVDFAIGPSTLPAFTPHGRRLYVTFVCLGKGKFALGTLFDYSPCDGVSSTTALEGQTNAAQRLTVKTEPSTTWRILITSGS